MALPVGLHVGPYEILTLLGAGGMGEVYKAHDRRLGRFVALKTLGSDKLADPLRNRRFMNEAQAASRLNHPGIVTIYDIFEHQGHFVIVMEYVQGKTLDELIASDPLGFQEAMRYASEIADALIVAHAAGIVHRDLKPANIMITEDGRPKILDFGLATSIRPAARLAPLANAPADVDVTIDAGEDLDPGVGMGTASYMSPEQAEGRHVDLRADIFSFGAVLYEMLSGQNAFRRDTWLSTLAAVLFNEPPALRQLRSDLPSAVEHCVARCLRKDPSLRFQNMTDVKAALSSTAVTETSKQEIPSIAVLPFANLSADKENDYFSDGLAGEILTALAKVPGLRVIGRTSAFAFRGADLNLHLIGRRLNVEVILEGSVQRAGNRVRVIAQLIRVADESQIWSDHYDREMTDIFAIQDEISQAIANALQVTLAAPRPRAASLETYHNYLKGLYHHQRYSQEGLEKARHFFEQALANDPNYAPAYAGLAAQYYTFALLGLKPMTEVAPLAKAAALKALALDPTLSDAHSILGVFAGTVDYDWKAAEKHFERAMAIDPVPGLIRVRYVLFYRAWWRRYDESVEQCRLALETDPLSMIVYFGLVMSLHWKRDFESAVRFGSSALDLSPDFLFVQLATGMAKLQLGCVEESLEHFRKAIEIAPWHSVASVFMAAAHARAGRREIAQQIIDELRERSRTQYDSVSCLAAYYASIGETGRVFECLESAVDHRDPYLVGLLGDPLFDPYRADPRYRALLDRMHLDST